MQDPDIEQLNYVRDKLAAAYAEGVSPSGQETNPRAIEAPQVLYAERIEECPVRVENGVVIFHKMTDSVELMRNKAVVQPGNGLLMGSPRPLLPLDLDGPLHTKYRKLMDPLFAPREVNQLEDTIRALANDLIDEFIEAGEVDAYSAFCEPLPSRIFISMLDLPESLLPTFVDWKDRTIKPAPGEPEAMLAGIQAAGAEMAEYIGGVIDERMASDHDGDDLLSRLMRADVDGEHLTRQQLCDITYLLMIAGLDTVTSSLSLALARLANTPELRRQLVDRPELMPNAVEEMLRYEAPVASSSRLVIEDIEVAGVSLPEGTYVKAVWQACNVDPDQYEQPLEVDFEREGVRHTSFATGPHRCMGSHLARVEMRWALEEWHKRIPDYSVADGREIEYTYGGVRAASSIPLSFPVG